jgi:hypothetical protein
MGKTDGVLIPKRKSVLEEATERRSKGPIPASHSRGLIQRRVPGVLFSDLFVRRKTPFVSVL